MGDISNNLKEIFGQALNNTSERSEESNKLKNNLQQITIITKFAWMNQQTIDKQNNHSYEKY